MQSIKQTFIGASSVFSAIGTEVTYILAARLQEKNLRYEPNRIMLSIDL
jgi:hypothetical protein